MSELKNRIDFVYIFDVKDGNCTLQIYTPHFYVI